MVIIFLVCLVSQCVISDLVDAENLKRTWEIIGTRGVLNTFGFCLELEMPNVLIETKECKRVNWTQVCLNNFFVSQWKGFFTTQLNSLDFLFALECARLWLSGLFQPYHSRQAGSQLRWVWSAKCKLQFSNLLFTIEFSNGQKKNLFCLFFWNCFFGSFLSLSFLRLRCFFSFLTLEIGLFSTKPKWSFSERLIIGAFEPCSLSRTLTLFTPTHTLSLSYTRTHSLTLSYTHTHAHTLTPFSLLHTDSCLQCSLS